MSSEWSKSSNSAYLSLSQGQVRYRQHIGEQPTLLFIHGLSYPLEVWTHLYSFAVAKGWNCICYDLYGRGNSSYNGQPLSTTALAMQCIELLDALQHSQSIHIVTLSNADLIALKLVEIIPDKIHSISMIAPSGFDQRTMNFTIRSFSRTPFLRDILGKKMQDRLHRRMNEHRQHLPKPPPNGSEDIYLSCMNSVRNNPFFAAAICSQIAYQSSISELRTSIQQLQNSSIPLLLLHFGNEADSTQQGTNIFSSLSHKKEIFNLPGTHMGLLEYPQIVWNELLHFWTQDIHIS